MDRTPVIVGIGLSDYPVTPHLDSVQHHVLAMQRALADAGIEKSEIDGYASAGGMMMAGDPVYMAEYLASLLPPQADVAVIGGPEVIDDIELVLGIVHGIQRSGLRLVNDPFVDRHRNREDVKEGGRADKPPAGAEWSNHRHAAETGQQVGLTTASSSKPGTPKIEMFSVVLSDANSLA